MAQDVPWILVAVADSGVRRCLKTLLPLSRPVLYAETVDGARDVLRHNPVGVVVADPPLLAGLARSLPKKVRAVAVLNGSDRPGDALAHRGVCVRLTAADARQALGRAIAPSVVTPLSPEPVCGRLVGASSAMKRVFERIRQVAAGDGNVFIQGETGTGKGLAAKAIHDHSNRCRAPFVVYDCAAFPPGLMEASLFGHRRGAFTGAHRNQRGCLAAAHGGTVFLDDIDNLDPARQAKLLRILQDKRFQCLGCDRVTRVDVRFVAATNRDPTEMLTSGALRRDLYYRLDVLPLRMPPLRERAGDVELLADYFAARWSDRTGLAFKSLSASARKLLATYSWPGNVRELQNIVERLQTLCQNAVIDGRAVGNALASESAAAPLKPMKRETRALARRLIQQALAQTDGNRTRAAALLGIHRNTLSAKLTAAQPAKKHRHRQPVD